MNDENRRRNIREELDRAEEARASAILLADSGHLADAISRLYYWVFHTVRALLLTESLEPRTHEGMLRLFSLHFVKEGPLDSECAHILSRLMKYRQEADYNPSYVFTAEDFEEFRREAEDLCGRVDAQLRRAGLL